MNSLGIFEVAVNATRIRSLFKVEMQQLLDSTALLKHEIVHELEERKELESTDVGPYTEQGRRLRKGTESLFFLRTGSSIIGSLTLI
jgi:hypothetical protein